MCVCPYVYSVLVICFAVPRSARRWVPWIWRGIGGSQGISIARDHGLPWTSGVENEKTKYKDNSVEKQTDRRRVCFSYWTIHTYIYILYIYIYIYIYYIYIIYIIYYIYYIYYIYSIPFRLKLCLPLGDFSRGSSQGFTRSWKTCCLRCPAWAWLSRHDLDLGVPPWLRTPPKKNFR